MDQEFLDGGFYARLRSHGFINLIGAIFSFPMYSLSVDAVSEIRLQVSLTGHLQAGRILVQVNFRVL